MKRLLPLLFAAGLALTTLADTAAAQVRAPLSAGDSHREKGRTLDASHARTTAPKARSNEKRAEGRELSGANSARSAPVKGR